jgi:hypothetical protein
MQVPGEEVSMLQRGELAPHFAVRKLDGSPASYDEIWQHKNLLLISMPVEESAERAAYVSRLEDQAQELTAHETACVITADDVPDLPRPGVVIADRWGEIYFVWSARAIADLPDIDEILESLRYVAHECPECQGEAR